MFKHWIVLFVLVFSGVTIGVDYAEAKRLGGGKSFGMQRQASPPVRQAPSAAPAQQAAPATAQAPAAAAAATAQSGWRKWAGPLAGLAAGIGLAALMSHLGIGAEFAGLLLGIAALMLVFFLVRRFLRGNQAQAREPAYAGNNYAGDFQPQAEPRLRSVPNASPSPARAESGVATAPVNVAATEQTAQYPADFDVASFTHHAKVNFIRLQAANDSCNLDDIRDFATPEMFAEIKLAIDERGCTTQKTDVVQLNAEVLEVTEEATRHIASVRYHGLLREAADVAPQPFDEIWHLVKPADGSRGWQLAGIQQL